MVFSWPILGLMGLLLISLVNENALAVTSPNWYLYAIKVVFTSGGTFGLNINVNKFLHLLCYCSFAPFSPSKKGLIPLYCFAHVLHYGERSVS